MASSPTRLSIDVEHTHLPSCGATGKCGYRSRAEALDIAESMMLQSVVMPGCHITPYHCDDCGWWHVYNRKIVFV